MLLKRNKEKTLTLFKHLKTLKFPLAGFLYSYRNVPQNPLKCLEAEFLTLEQYPKRNYYRCTLKGSVFPTFSKV